MFITTDELSTDLDTGPDSYTPPATPAHWQVAESGPFDLDNEYLVCYPSTTDIFVPSSPDLGSDASGPAQEMDDRRCQLEDDDKVQKVTKLDRDTRKRHANFLKPKEKRPKLGSAFSQFLKENAEQDKDDFLTSLGRDFVKKITFCVRAEKTSFEQTFKELAKLHSTKTKNVKMPASEETRGLYWQLYSRYITMPDRKILHSYERSITAIKSEKHYRSFHIGFQRYFYAPKNVRLMYRHYMEFLDGFGLEGEGVRLGKELRLTTGKTRYAKDEMMDGYLRALGLVPFDRVTEAKVFRVLRGD